MAVNASEKRRGMQLQMMGKDFGQESERVEPSRVFDVDDDDVVSVHEIKASDDGKNGTLFSIFNLNC